MWGACFLYLLLAVTVANVAVDRHNGYNPELLQLKRATVGQEIGTDWTTFYFTNKGSYSFPTFFINANAGDSIQLTDYFCCGDTFTIYIEFPSIPLFVGFNTSNPVVVSCDTYQLEPTLAYLFGQFSRLSYTFPDAAFANITIVANTSPFTAGGGAIRKALAPTK